MCIWCMNLGLLCLSMLYLLLSYCVVMLLDSVNNVVCCVWMLVRLMDCVLISMVVIGLFV